MNSNKQERTEKTSRPEWERTLPATTMEWCEKWQGCELFHQKTPDIYEAASKRLSKKRLTEDAREYICQDVVLAIVSKSPEYFENNGIANAHLQLRNFISKLCSVYTKKYLISGEKGERKNLRVAKSTFCESFEEDDFFVESSFKAWQSTNKNILAHDLEEIELAISKLNDEEQLLMIKSLLNNMTGSEINRIHFPKISRSTFYTNYLRARDQLIRFLEAY